MRENVLSPWRPRPGEWDRRAAAHLLRRAGFGAGPGELERAVEEGFEASLGRVLEDEGPDERLLQGVEALLPAGDVGRLAAWWMSLILSRHGSLRERVALMWHDHFATSNHKVADVRLMHRQNLLFRERGLGDFRELLHEVARDPAMLVWLDGNANRRGQPNENFAREVMELFALGIGNYGEEDVREAARAFTGWGTEGRAFVVREDQHDPGVKRILGRSGAFDGDGAIDVILAHPPCSRHVARRLLEELVAPEPPREWIEDTARTLVDNGWHVGRTIEAILASGLFFSPAARRSRIASPVELIAMSVRALDARVSPLEAAEASARMGQSLFRPPSVKGWDGMHSWINAGTWVARHNTLVALAEAHVGEEKGIHVDLRAAFGAPASTAEVPRAVMAVLLPDLQDHPIANVLDRAAEGAGDVDDALALVTALVLTSPEYQLV